MTEKNNSQSANALYMMWYLGGISTNYILRNADTVVTFQVQHLSVEELI
jgi:hypothetical protein